MAQILSTNTFTTAKWIVSALASDGTHTTIGAALTSASSGDTIFIRDGTYTENITLKSGVDLVSYEADALEPNVIINGSCTFSVAGTVSISGIEIQTNSLNALIIGGTVSTIVNLRNCNINCLNTTGIAFSSSNAASQINITDCIGNIGTTGITLFTHTSAGNLNIISCNFSNSGSSTTASTCSGSGSIIISKSGLTFPVTTSGTSQCTFEYTNIDVLPQNVIALTVGGSGTTQLARFSRFVGGTQPSVSIGSALTMDFCEIYSTNTNAITGAGTVSIGVITFTGSSSLINTTTQIAIPITFATVAGGTVTSNSLSIYQEGTFIPTMIGNSTAGTTTYTIQNGYYRRIGNMVTVQAHVEGSGATGSVVVLFGALPFTIKNQTNGNPVGSLEVGAAVTWPVGSTYLVVEGQLNTTTMLVYGSGTASAGGFLALANVAFKYKYTITYEI